VEEECAVATESGDEDSLQKVDEIRLSKLTPVKVTAVVRPTAPFRGSTSVILAGSK